MLVPLYSVRLLLRNQLIRAEKLFSGIFRASPPRPLNSQLTQFFLQALPVKSNRRRRPRHIPFVPLELSLDIGDLEFSLCLAKIRLRKRHFVARRLSRPRRPPRVTQNLSGQIGFRNHFSVREYHAS